MTQRSYLGATGDSAWLDDVTNLEFALNMARFWESRPTFDQTKDRWEINGNNTTKYPAGQETFFRADHGLTSTQRPTESEVDVDPTINFFGLTMIFSLQF